MTAYRDESLPSVNGKPFAAPVYGNFGAILQLKQLHPKLRVLISLGGQLGDPSGWVAAAHHERFNAPEQRLADVEAHELSPPLM